MLSKMVSTITSLSLRVNSASRETSSIRSAFVIARSLQCNFVEITCDCKAQERAASRLHKLLKMLSRKQPFA